MKLRAIGWVLLAASLFLGLGARPACSSTRGECSLCGMWLDEHANTRHVVTLKNRATYAFCSLACTGKYLKEKASEVRRVRVADYRTGKLSDAHTAHYVLGSDAPAVMSAISSVAFQKMADAASFQKQHGGKVVDFPGALRANQE